MSNPPYERSLGLHIFNSSVSLWNDNNSELLLPAKEPAGNEGEGSAFMVELLGNNRSIAMLTRNRVLGIQLDAIRLSLPFL